MSDPSPCPHCGSASTGRPFPDAHPWLTRCEACGLGFADPQPTDAELDEIYAGDYYDQFGFGRRGEAGLRRMKVETTARMLALVGRGGGGRMLDVGCGLGYSLLAGERCGWDPHGLEPHELAGRGLADRLAKRVARGTLEDYTPERPFDLVTLVDTIEHVRDPVATIRRAGELVAPGGTLLLATNDLSSKGARRMGPRWVHFHRAHLWFFSPATLEAAIEQAGLRAVGAYPARRIYNLQYVCGILARGDNFPLAAGLSRLALRALPPFVQLACWPAVIEGMVLLARREC